MPNVSEESALQFLLHLDPEKALGRAGNRIRDRFGRSVTQKLPLDRELSSTRSALNPMVNLEFSFRCSVLSRLFLPARASSKHDKSSAKIKKA
jgi:hypothetical protein